ncbi:MAG: hypothetical protein KAR83_04600, partial [Thermodesulfovibrionales bacterium]|nr:hypothetical protein [Thermodesulfovibrionales bacterium]
MTTETKDTGNWLEISRQENHSLFSEMDVILKSLDRFFLPDNQPASAQDMNSKNLLAELKVVRNGIYRLLSIIEVIMPESNRNAYWFQKFAESKLLDNVKRDRMRAGLYKQDTPEKSLYVLYNSFLNLKSMINDIIRTQDIHFMSFKNTGEFISKELRENAYFNPFSMDINPAYDYIENKQISEVIRNISNNQFKKVMSILVLHLFRMLRYMKTMDHRSLNETSMSCSLMIFTLLKSEIEMFRAYIVQSVKNLEESDLTMLIETLSYQFGMESKRVFRQELKDIYVRDNKVKVRGKIESSRGILKNLTEQTIIQMVKYWNPELRGEDIFDVFITKTAQSIKLREDVYVLGKLVAAVGKVKSDQRRSGVLTMLMNYMEY